MIDFQFGYGICDLFSGLSLYRGMIILAQIGAIYGP